MAHAGVGGGAMPVALTGREPHDVARTDFFDRAARALHEPGGYIGSVVAAQPVPSPVATGKGGLRR